MSYRHRHKGAARRARMAEGGQSLIGGFLLWLFKLGIQILIISSVLLGIIVYRYSNTIAPLEEIIDGRRAGSVTFIDRKGKVFAWRGQQFDANLRTGNAAKTLINAIIATEDKRYFEHFGISPRGIGRALYTNFRKSGNPFRGQGGSTITTQVAKLLCLGIPYDEGKGSVVQYEAECRRSTLDRKLREIPYSLALELRFTKEEILSIYLNRAYLGAGTYGFAAASNRYFGIPASALDTAQSAMLAGMLTAPSRYSPTSNLVRAQERSATVVRLMHEQGFISTDEARAAIERPARLAKGAASDLGVFFADWIMQDQPDFLTSNTSEDIVFYTTFDPVIQQHAENAVAKITSGFAPGSRAEVAMVIMNRSGAVRAMVGGRFSEDRIEQGFNRATQARRQPGSAFKPFVYAAALNDGIHPYDIFVDSPIVINVPGSGKWKPKNYTEKHIGPVTMAHAMEQSINTIAVELSERVGRDKVRALAHAFGIESDITDKPSLALGASEVTLLELTSGYAGILNDARAVTPYGWTKMATKLDGGVIATNEPFYGAPVMNKENVSWLIYMMNQVVKRGTGSGARIDGYEIAGKTGTSTEAKDAWFIGFSGDYIAGVWLGYDDNTPLRGTTGGGFPADIWREAMRPILASQGAKPLPMSVPQPRVPRGAPNGVMPGEVPLVPNYPGTTPPYDPHYQPGVPQADPYYAPQPVQPAPQGTPQYAPGTAPQYQPIPQPAPPGGDGYWIEPPRQYYPQQPGMPGGPVPGVPYYPGMPVDPNAPMMPGVPLLPFPLEEVDAQSAGYRVLPQSG